MSASWDRLRQECAAVLLDRFAPGPRPAGPRRVGIENEYVVTTADGAMAPPAAVAALWPALAALGWELLRDPWRGTPTGARLARPGGGPEDVDLLTTDYGYATVEVNVAPERSLHDAGGRLAELLDLVAGILDRRGAVLLGYGAQPVTGPAPGQLGPSSRYPLLAAARRAELGGRDVTGDLLCLSASAQTQVEVGRGEAVGVADALAATSGARAALLANSAVWGGRDSGQLAARELFWDRWWPARVAQTGVPPRCRDAERWVDLLAGHRPLLATRAGRTVLALERPPLRELLLSGRPVRARGVDGAPVALRVTPADLPGHLSVCWYATRLHPRHGTVEDRVGCQQPPEAPLAAAALTLGLVERSADLLALFDRLPWDAWRELRVAGCTGGLRARSGGVDVAGVAADLLAVAAAGLRDRGLAEEAHLEPLAERLAARRAPAEDAVRLLRTGGPAALVRRYAVRPGAVPAGTVLSTDAPGEA